ILERAEDIRPLLTYLADHGLFPGTELQVLEANPYAGSVIIAVKGHTTPIARETAEQIWVYPVR
ncbi:MAG: ferrous iron transport protein A, partial [Clostridia bacterium]|nr:ferrous iron transport protein A [Clostridia bacterium]